MITFQQFCEQQAQQPQQAGGVRGFMGNMANMAMRGVQAAAGAAKQGYQAAAQKLTPQSANQVAPQGEKASIAQIKNMLRGLKDPIAVSIMKDFLDGTGDYQNLNSFGDMYSNKNLAHSLKDFRTDMQMDKRMGTGAYNPANPAYQAAQLARR